MEDTFQTLNTATWFKLEKDRTTHFIPVFTDYSVSTSLGTMLYDKDIIPRKLSSELPIQSLDDTRVWFLDFDSENMTLFQTSGINIPASMETVGSLAQLRAAFNKRQLQQ